MISKIEPELSNNSFYKICEKILEEFDLTEYQRIFDLFRFIRNSLHNNGIITDPHAYSILYDGKIYRLEQNKSIQVNWWMLSKLSLDMQDCLNKIVSSQRICQLKEILDPSYFANEISYETYDV